MSSTARAARTAKERDWRYDVLVNAPDTPLKLAFIKSLQAVLPEIGLKQALEIAQSPIPAVVVGNVPARVARRIKAKLRQVWADVSVRSTVSTRPQAKDIISRPWQPKPPTFVPDHTLECEVSKRLHHNHQGCGCRCHKETTDE